MKVWVKADICQGHAMCLLNAPAVFQIDHETGHAFLASEDVSPDLEEAVDQAARGCPEQAIVIDRGPGEHATRG